MSEVIKNTENKKGYKKTKLGWIPEEWDVKRLGDFGNFKNGISKGGENFGFGTPIIGLNDVFGKFYITKNNPDSLVNASEQELIDFNLNKGDVLFVRSSVKPEGVGLPCVVESNLEKTTFSGFLIRFRDTKGILNDKYKRYCFLLEYFRHRLLSKSTISANTNINQPSLASLNLIIPSLKEQEKIAEILSAWDEGIETLEKLIETKKRYLKNIAIKLLSKGTNCSEWKEFSLGSISIPINEKVSEKTLPVLSITAGRGFVLQADKFGKNIAGNQYKNYTLLHKNEFSYNKGNSKKYAQGCIYCLKEYEEASVPNVFISFKLKNEISLNEYFEQLFKYNFHGVKLKKYINSGVRDDGLLNLNSNNFFKIKFKIPQIDEQQKIVNILNSYDEEIQILNSKLEKLKEQKKGLMQQLLTGKIRVKV